MTVAVRTALQVAGRASVADELRARLNDAGYHRFRFCVAFARWSGLHLIDADLQAFANRPGNAIDGLVGIDLGGTTIEALTYLAELPKTRLRVVRSGAPNIVFHPKLYEISGPGKWCVVIGSSNLSTGGLLANIEASLIVEGRRGDANPAEALFAKFDAPPFAPNHVQIVDDQLLAELAPLLSRYTGRPPDRGWWKSAKGVPTIDPAFKPPTPPSRPPSGRGVARTSKTKRAKRPKTPVTTKAQVPIGPKELYMELWDETRDGTQVQMSKKVFTEYFGGDVSAVTYVDLDTPGGKAGPARLQAFGNSTFRIPLTFVGSSTAGAGRRGVLQFRRLGRDRYAVRLRLGHQAGYSAWLKRCTDRTTPTSKRFGMY